MLQRPEDVFSLADKKDEVLALSRWGEKSFQKLVDEVASAKHPELARFVYALGIRHVGEQTARDLADQIESLRSSKLPRRSCSRSKASGRRWRVRS
ncbi:MAG: helix-hairpin-helix domain-containing protein [Planctomycetota bacterium]